MTRPELARRPTLVSYVWCSACRKFVGTRARTRRAWSSRTRSPCCPTRSGGELERSLVGFLAHLDELWDDGVLPQTFAA